ncbi:hypothetical protein Ae201684P_007003 [Aphanomyces euteiches]|uniref:Leucine-rich repeat-containing N-terminal plant-type domain-containing protein n=1 Tax=Aphanomyces euteiches TaxID=100861 RepID=A0A6G0WV05_9STRA|nr:hypothetical protein Ae201684_011368 [Aphanomyces euteiches]KAH9100809.1 hypothetical protein Ae201684P_007003 [Aphanomyces euteiches]KAH9144375.1 hypothetical protein AeRB84_011680 [Aphanomyces euteiches]
MVKVTSDVIFLLGVAATTASAFNTLTQCSSSKNLTLPCVIDDSTGTTTLVESQGNQSYNFANLNISYIKHIPQDARWIDLSYNQINDLWTDLPPTLTFLNLSHNALKSHWIQTRIPATILDVSYNQGGLAWPTYLDWEYAFPNLTRFIFRGNNLTKLMLVANQFPDKNHPLRAIDVSGNPNLIWILEYGMESSLAKNFTLTADSNSYNDTLHACQNKSFNVGRLQPVLAEYSPAGDVKYSYASASQYFHICKTYQTKLPRSVNVSPHKLIIEYRTNAQMSVTVGVAIVSTVVVVQCLYFASMLTKHHEVANDQPAMQLAPRQQF